MRREWIDWNCRLLPGMREGTESAEEAIALLRKLKEDSGILRFCMMPQFDPAQESVRAFLLRRQNAKERLMEALPEKIYIRVCAAMLLSEGCSELQGLEKLTLLPGLLPLRPPIAAWTDWMDKEMNHLLFRRRLTPLFLSFELSTILYSNEIVLKMMRIPNAAFQFSFRSLTDPAVCRIIHTLLQENHTVLLGSGIRHQQKAEDYDIAHYLFRAEDHLSPADRNTLLNSNISFWKKSDHSFSR